MPYNFHPIFVHFPIALLVLYSVIKILPLQKWFPKIAWRDIERVLLAAGVLGAFAALWTGEDAEHLLRPDRALVEAHSTFATITTWLYGALLAGELAAMLNARANSAFIANFTKIKFVSKILLLIERIFCSPLLSATIAFVALIALFVTGVLGGVITHGFTSDPLAPLILKLLNININ